MKWLKLSENDFDLFDYEINCEQEAYLQSRMHLWEEMFYVQGKAFWLQFLITYRSFIWRCGFANELCEKRTFPVCINKLKRLIDEACISLHKGFVEGNFSDAKTFFDCIVVVVKNRHLIQFLASKSSLHNPFFHNDTKGAYRHLFGNAGNTIAITNVAAFIPFYIKFAGAICNIFKRWIRKNNPDDNIEEQYWSVPKEWHDTDFKPGVFEQYLQLYWKEELVSIFNIGDIYKRFNREMNKNSCYLEDSKNICMCEMKEYTDGLFSDADETFKNIRIQTRIVDVKMCKCSKKSIKLGECQHIQDYFPLSIVSDTIEVKKKSEVAKERLRKKLNKKLKNDDDIAFNSDKRMKLLQKAEKKLQKETKLGGKVKSNVKQEEKLGVKDQLVCSKADDKDVSETEGCVKQENANALQKNFHSQNVQNEDSKDLFPKSSTKISIHNKHKSEESKHHLLQEVEKNIKEDKQKQEMHSEVLEEPDDFAKDLEDIGDNLETIEKSIRENGGLDLEEFKLLLETGKLLMKGNKSAKTCNNEEKPSCSKDAHLHKLRVCAQCMTKEPAPKTFKKCSRCKTEKFPIPRYYCSKRCQVEDWEESHRQEHLCANKQ